MVRNMLAILMLFHQDIPNISLFPSIMVDLADLVTRDGTPLTRSIFGVYILLLGPCLNVEAYDWMKKAIYIVYRYCQIDDMSRRDKGSGDVSAAKLNIAAKEQRSHKWNI